MAAISRTPHLDRAINTATLLTRTAVAVGVPLYLYYAKGAATPKVLPQLLTPAILTDALTAPPAG